MPIFDSLTRASGPRRANEPFFEFLSRLDDPFAEFTRTTVNDWFNAYPAQHQNDIARKIQQPDAIQYHAGVFELFIHELLRRRGATPTVVPTATGQRTHDFDALDGGRPVMVEVTITSDAPKAEWSRLGELREAFRSLQSDDVSVRVLRRGTVPPDLKAKQVRFDVNRFLGSPEVADYVTRVRNGERLRAPTLTIQFKDGELLVEPVVRRITVAAGDDKDTLLDWFDGPLELATIDKIRSALERKAGRYGAITQPYVIALNVFGDRGVDDGEIVTALYGQGLGDSINGRRDGFWHQNRHTRVSGVIVSRGVVPAPSHDVPLELYLNPWATNPVTGNELLGLPKVHAVGDALAREDGQSLSEVFR